VKSALKSERFFHDGPLVRLHGSRAQEAMKRACGRLKKVKSNGEFLMTMNLV
jgi:hypothetical protein